MAFEKLSHEEQKIVLSCLRAIADGPFIRNDWEFHTRFGVHYSTLYKIIKIWPNIDDSVDDSDETLVINNTMNEICHGISLSDADWDAWFNVDRDAIKAVYKRWDKLKGNSSK